MPPLKEHGRDPIGPALWTYPSAALAIHYMIVTTSTNLSIERNRCQTRPYSQSLGALWEGDFDCIQIRFKYSKWEGAEFLNQVS